MRPLLIALFSLAACNSAPKDTCTAPTSAVLGAGAVPASCDGICAALPTDDGGAADAGLVICTVDCTDAGQAACTASGKTCVSARDKGFAVDKSYCVFTCDDASTCPAPYFCIPDAGVCL